MQLNIHYKQEESSTVCTIKTKTENHYTKQYKIQNCMRNRMPEVSESKKSSTDPDLRWEMASSTLLWLYLIMYWCMSG